MEDPSHLKHLGVPLFGKDDRLTYIREKPETPPSPYAVIGIYMYDPGVFEIVRTLKPSGRGELEITDVNNDYVDRGPMEYDALHDVDAIVNFAAETHVDRSILEPDAFVKTDVLGTWHLAEAARAAGISRFLQVSTDEVYGAILDGASRETDRLDPTSPYSAAKAGGELLVLAAYKTYGLPALVVRGANAYGPYQYP